jgi:hypothetical protein
MRATLFVAALACMSADCLASAGPTTRPETTFKPNPKLAGIAPNTWKKIGPPPPAPKGIMAYSGGVFDSAHNVFLIFGGGHADYWGNEVCAFDLKTLKWRKMYEPDARSRYTNDNIDNKRGKLRDSDKPYTRHSYEMMAFVPTVAKMFIWSGCGPGWGNIRPTCPAPPDAWYYDYQANRWELLTTDGPHCYDGGTAYDTKRDVVWAFPGGSWKPIWKFDVKKRAWSKHKLKPEVGGGLGTRMEYSPKRDRLHLTTRGGKDVVLIDPARFTVEKLDTSAYTPASGGTVYLPDQDTVVHLGWRKTAPMGVLDFDRKRWLPHKPAGQALPQSRGYNVFGRLKYSAIDDVVIFVGPGGTWAWRPPKRFEQLAASPTTQPGD